MTLSKIKENNKFFIKTYGCQMNVHDSGLIENGLVKSGFKKAYSVEDADIVVFNTCSVRDNADHKVISELGRLKKNYVDKKIVLAGCFAKQIKLKKEQNGSIYFDYCFAPEEIFSIPDILKNNTAANDTGGSNETSQGFSLTERPEEYFENDGKIEEYFYDKMPENGTASVKITEGCNNFCSYCIVPYVRGRERSIPIGIIYKTIKNLINKGAAEITLLGQNVNSYMSPDDCKKDFCFLLNAASGIEGSFKIKFLTSHPKDFNDKLIDTVCGNDKISKEIHLPVQSGSDKILATMNRGYTNADYLKLVRKLKNGHPDISISTDIIVGFPGETEEDFKDTLKLIEEAEFSSIFAFKYSPRPFTKASKFNDNILLEVKKERLEKVFQKYKEISLRHCGRWIAQP
ncbi:MAG: tRNA (N6-isopentenyl adenosine(37)-C2)-methylthiotransferase MiaB [Deltaproteobacteria bacterium]|nr:tRNA (N6-isopentenyl adenosine(37)-C2)-methylthiotransferase MiaB [Deltaproteobacteria bacterium]